MRTLTDLDDAWLSVGSLRTPQTDARTRESRIAGMRPVAWFRRTMRRVAAPESAVALNAESLIPALSSIRASAEILRDTPDICPADRRRFAEIVLAEEARLEAMVKSLSGGSDLARE